VSGGPGPEAPWEPAAEATPGRGRLDRLSLVMGVVFALTGVVFLLDALEVWELRVDYLVPLGLIGLGVVVLASGWPLGRRR
jgi:hypothetical protein